MTLFHCYRCWLFYIVIFIPPPMDECDHPLGLLITLEVILWAIISLLYWYISLSPLSAGLCGIKCLVTFITERCCCFTVASVYCWFCLTFFLLADECDQSLWSLIVKKALYQSIVSSLCIIVSYMTIVGSKLPCHIIQWLNSCAMAPTFCTCPLYNQ